MQKKKGDISSEQQEVLDLLTHEYLTPKQVAQRRGTSTQAVYKTIKKLQEKGKITRSYSRGLQSKRGGLQKRDPTNPLVERMKKGMVRLHAQHFRMRIIRGSRFYDGLRRRSNMTFMDGNVVKLHRGVVEVQAHELCSFVGSDEHAAWSRSMEYWSGLFVRLENRLRVLLLKEGYDAVHECYAEFAEVGSEVAVDAERRKVRVELYAPEDGKLWFQVDNSWALHEAETRHPVSAKEDMRKFKKQLDDWRSYDPPTNSELSRHVDALVADREFYAEAIREHVGAIQELGSGVRRLSGLVEKLNGVK